MKTAFLIHSSKTQFLLFVTKPMQERSGVVA